MKVTDELIDNLAHLSRLHFSESEKTALKGDFERILNFVEQLSEIDTTGVEPLLHMGDAINVLREDEVKGSVTRQEALLNAPLHDDVFFKVPKVIKNPSA
ncbi:Asp-tRNA(Asn)/Glu-tRNA(Gln) amidotransferase subunit GatC [Danxiaibacter flavus]|uniref:Aspartyl/glutamyl-tRNA(Asn/Gln) amidotransferase subunit C n=1 Tax=Danxiaibacter flavus TaxID=3049108 RepID=A0ABV3ZC98_9BACT|nr:Asp-tRNA(Asn)/Glu-tRNA(Gln) amidotransferase subunit GatC [Chitinophagaceae bacterium DXS]